MSIILETVTSQQLEKQYKDTGVSYGAWWGGYSVFGKRTRRKGAQRFIYSYEKEGIVVYVPEMLRLVQDDKPVNLFEGCDMPQVVEYLQLGDIGCTVDNTRVLFGDQLQMSDDIPPESCGFRLCLPNDSKFVMTITRLDKPFRRTVFTDYTKWSSYVKHEGPNRKIEYVMRYMVFDVGFRGVLFDEQQSRSETIRIANSYFD